MDGPEFAAISTDTSYVIPKPKQSAYPLHVHTVISEWQVFNMLDSLKPTAADLDNLPSWFLRLGAPIFYKHVTILFNMSISQSFIPTQWKEARIHPIPKIPST